MIMDRGVSKFVDGDARVAENRSDHFASTHTAVNASEQGRGSNEYGVSAGKRGGGGGGKNQPAKFVPPPPPALPSQHTPRRRRAWSLCAKVLMMAPALDLLGEFAR